MTEPGEPSTKPSIRSLTRAILCLDFSAVVTPLDLVGDSDILAVNWWRRRRHREQPLRRFVVLAVAESAPLISCFTNSVSEEDR